MASSTLAQSLGIENTTAPMILILGQTGAGKSHFCNKVMGEDADVVKESAHLSSCTSKPELVPAKVDGNEYLFVDTPGFNDTWRDLKRSDARILGEIAQTLTLQSELGVNLRGILYLYDITAKRMTGETLRQFELIKRICGDRNYGNVLLVTTHWPERIEDQKKQQCAIREGDLRRDFWKEMIAGGSTMCRFDDHHSTAKSIVRRLAGKPNITLALQEEMAGGKTLKKTTAFSFIVRARQQDEDRLKGRSSKDLERGIDDKSFGDPNLDSVNVRKEAEDSLNDDIVSRVREAIRKEDEEARKRDKKPSVKDIIRWLIGISSLAMGVAQVAMQA